MQSLKKQEEYDCYCQMLWRRWPWQIYVLILKDYWSRGRKAGGKKLFTQCSRLSSRTDREKVKKLDIRKSSDGCYDVKDLEEDTRLQEYSPHQLCLLKWKEKLFQGGWYQEKSTNKECSLYIQDKTNNTDRCLHSLWMDGCMPVTQWFSSSVKGSIEAAGARVIIKVLGHQYRWSAGGYDLEIGHI